MPMRAHEAPVCVTITDCFTVDLTIYEALLKYDGVKHDRRM